MINILKDKFLKDTHLSELLRGSAISFVLRLLGVGLGYVFVLLLTRAYGVKAMGIFTIAFTILQIASVVSRLGMDTLILRFTSEYTTKNNAKDMISKIYKKVLFVTILFSILVSVLLYVSGPFIAEFIFKKPELSNAIELISFGVLPMTMLVIHREVLRGLKKILFFSFFNSIAISLFASIAILIFTYLSTNVLTPLYAQIIAITISAILAFIILKHSIDAINTADNENLTKIEKIISLKDMFFIAFPMMFAGSLFMIMNWTDTFMLGMYSNINDVGVYSVALKVAALTSIVLMAINSISAPKFAEMWGKQNLIGLERVVKQSTKLIFWSSLPALFLIWIFPSFILGIFGTQFKAGVLALIFLSLGQFINAISGSVNYLLNMTGYEKIVQNNIAIALLINILLNYLLIPIYGINGAAFASLISMIFWNFAGVVYIKYKFHFWIFYVPFPVKKYKRNK